MKMDLELTCMLLFAWTSGVFSLPMVSETGLFPPEMMGDFFNEGVKGNFDTILFLFFQFHHLNISHFH